MPAINIDSKSDCGLWLKASHHIWQCFLPIAYPNLSFRSEISKRQRLAQPDSSITKQRFWVCLRSKAGFLCRMMPQAFTAKLGDFADTYTCFNCGICHPAIPRATLSWQWSGHPLFTWRFCQPFGCSKWILLSALFRCSTLSFHHFNSYSSCVLSARANDFVSSILTTNLGTKTWWQPKMQGKNKQNLDVAAGATQWAEIAEDLSPTKMWSGVRARNMVTCQSMCPSGMDLLPI